MSCCCCAAIADPALFRAILRIPELRRFHPEVRDHLRLCIPEEEDAISTSSSEASLKPYDVSSNGEIFFPLRISVDVSEELWNQHVNRFGHFRSSLRCQLSQGDEAEIKPTVVTSQEAKREKMNGLADVEEEKDELPIKPIRRMSTVTTMVVEKRQRLLDDDEDGAENEKGKEKEIFLSRMFRYSKDYKSENRIRRRKNASSTFMRVIQSTFEKYRRELKELTLAGRKMYKELGGDELDDNSISAMLSLCEISSSEVSIIEQKLEAASLEESALTESDRQSLCRLMDTLVKMLDELKNEMVRIRRIGDDEYHYQKRFSRTSTGDIEHFV